MLLLVLLAATGQTAEKTKNTSSAAAGVLESESLNFCWTQVEAPCRCPS